MQISYYLAVFVLFRIIIVNDRQPQFSQKAAQPRVKEHVKEDVEEVILKGDIPVVVDEDPIEDIGKDRELNEDEDEEPNEEKEVKEEQPGNSEVHINGDNWGTKSQRTELGVLIIGKPTTGKSTLISGLLGRDVKRSSVADVPFLTTSTVQVGEVTVQILFWNSPGVYNSDLDNEKKVCRVKNLLESIDLVIYTMKMDDTRMRPEDVEIMRKLTQTFGATVWEKALFVLTFANRVSYLNNRQQMRRSKDHHNRQLGQWKEHVHTILCDLGLPKDLIRYIPFIPAGHSAEPRLFRGEKPWRDYLMESISARIGEDLSLQLTSTT